MTQPKKTQCSKIKKKPLKCRQNNIEDEPIQGNRHRATTKIHIWKLKLHFFSIAKHFATKEDEEEWKKISLKSQI